MDESDRLKTDNFLKILGVDLSSLKIGKGKIIFISGGAYSGKTTMAKRIARQFSQFRILNTGDFFREEAKKRSISIGEFMKASGKELMELDKAVDSRMIRRLAETDENLIFVGRMASLWAEILKSIGKPFLSIFLMVNRKEKLRRMARREFGKDFSKLSKGEVGRLKKEMERDGKDISRYQALYGLNPLWFSKYANSIDTSCLTKNKVWKIVEELVYNYALRG